MTIHEPQTEQAPDRVRPRVVGTPAPARKTDYRLRGLDLEAPQVIEVAPRTLRKAHPSHRRRRRRMLIQWAIVLTVVAVTAVLLRAYVLQPYSVRSTSMVPTIQPGTNVLVVRPSQLTGSIAVGDIVVIHPPAGSRCADTGGSSQDMVKRVIGRPGQTIWSAGERIYVDGRPLQESGWYNPPFGELGPTAIARTTIAPDSYFVLGDNRTDPCDSRSFGTIPGSSVVGKVVATTTRNSHLFVHLI